MKVKEILLELAEVLNRHGGYGAWIDTNTGKVIPVKMHKHREVIEDYLYKNGVFAEGNPMEFAMKKGFVRVVHDQPNSLDINGTGEAILKAAPIINASIAQPDLDDVTIEKDNDWGDTFLLPQQRSQAQQYIRAG